MRLLNIDKECSDAFYRYKMEPVAVKIEGRGNGIKTVLPNIETIAKNVDRDARHLTKYLSYEMGAQSIIDEKNTKYIVNGAHDRERVQEYIYKFIDELVLCSECRNPETVLFCVPAKKTIWKRCKSCGSEENVKSIEKMTKMFVKELPDRAQIEDKDDSTNFGQDTAVDGYAFGK